MSLEASDIFIDPSQIQDAIEKIQQESQFLLRIPDELIGIYRDALEKRFGKMGVNVKIVALSSTKENEDKFDLSICFKQFFEQANKKDGSMFDSKNKKLFSFKETPKVQIKQQVEKLHLFHTKLDSRYNQLNILMQKYESKDGLMFLSKLYHQACNYIFSIKKLKFEREVLNKRILGIKSVIFHGILYVLLEAIEGSMNLIRLKDVMKRYVRIILVDDIGEKTCDELVLLGFSKRRIKIMNTTLFGKLFKEFKFKKREKFPDSVIGMRTMLTECDIFDDFEIMIYNPWKYEKGKLEVEVGIRNSLLLNKKENEIGDQDLEKIDDEIQGLELEVKSSKDALEKLLIELKYQKIEAYENRHKIKKLEQEKKQLKQKIFENSKKIGDIERILKQKNSITLYRKDLIEVIKESKSHDLKNRLKNVFHDYSSIDSSLEDQLNSGSINKKGLKEHTTLVEDKRKIEKKISSYHNKLTAIFDKMDFYKAEYSLPKDLDVKKELGIHTLNSIEQKVLKYATSRLSEIINLYPGSFFEVETKEKEALDWKNIKVEKINLFIATKRPFPFKREMEFYFRINQVTEHQRVFYSLFSPSSTDLAGTQFQAFIIDYSSFNIDDVIKFLTVRNKSNCSHIPVLIFFPTDAKLNKKDKLKLDCVVGLKQGENGEIFFDTPPYFIRDDVDSDTLFSIFSELFGVSDITVPKLGESNDNVDKNTQENGKVSDKRAFTLKQSDAPSKALKQSTTKAFVENKIHIDIPLTQEVFAVDTLLDFEDEERSVTENNTVSEDEERSVTENNTVSETEQVGSEENEDSRGAQEAVEDPQTSEFEDLYQLNENEDIDDFETDHLF